MAGDDRGRRSRGFASEGIVAEDAQDLWPTCVARPHGQPGTDLLNTGTYAVEVKARNEFRPQQWYRQALKNSFFGQKPLVIVRMNGQGKETLDEWLTFTTWGFMKGIIREAQYGAIALGERGSSPDSQADPFGLGPGMVTAHDIGSALSEAASTAIFRRLGIQPENEPVGV